jgi:hypothetical protein
MLKRLSGIGIDLLNPGSSYLKLVSIHNSWDNIAKGAASITGVVVNIASISYSFADGGTPR